MNADLSPSIDLARESAFELGGVPVRPSHREIGEGAARETLEPRVMQVLVALARRLGEVVSRDELIAACWGGRIVGDDAINRCIAKVRRAGDAHSAFTIETVPRVGYRLALQDAEATPRRRAPRRWLWAAVVAALTVAVAASLAVWRYQEARQLTAWQEPRSVVLPFEALSADPASLTFAAAADGEITGWLNEDHLQTVSPSRAKDAHFTVKGTVQGDGERLRARVTLEDSRSDLAVWSGDFDRPVREAAALQSEIGFRVAALMRSAADARRHSRGRVSPAAMALYVQSRDTILTAPERSLALAEQLVRQDPGFAPGHGVLCQGLLASARTATPEEFGPLKVRSLVECRQALALDPGFAVPYLVLANAEPGRNWTQREAHLRLAQAKAPGPDPDFGLGSLFLFMGRQEEGVRLLRRSVAVRPSWTISALNLAHGLHSAGRTQEAQDFAAAQLALRPDDAHLRRTNFLITAFSQPAEQGLAILDDPRRRPTDLGSRSLEALRVFLAARGSGAASDRAAAAEVIVAAAEARQLSSSSAIPMLSQLGELDAAFAQADAYSRNPATQRLAFSLQPDFLFGPEAAAMRADPRFVPLVQRLGLLDYWRGSGHWPDFCAREPKSVCAKMRGTSTGP